MFKEVEARYRENMEAPLSKAHQIGRADIVIGIPFYNEADTIAHVIKVAKKGMAQFFPDSKCAIIAAGSPRGEEALKAISAMRPNDKTEFIAFTFDDELLNGKGWSVRAIVDIADRLGADLILLEADLLSRKSEDGIEGLSPQWIRLLLEPIKQGEMDMVISRFKRHYLESPVSTLSYPLFSAIYNCPIRRLTGGQWGIAHHLLKSYLSNVKHAWRTEISGYGVDAWLATVAITNGARICEANLGIKVRHHSPAKADLVFRHVAKVLFDQIMNERDWWGKPGELHDLPLLRRLPKVGIPSPHQPDAVHVAPQIRIAKYKEGFNRYHLLYEKIFPEEAYRQLADLSQSNTDQFEFPAGLWAQAVYDLILAYTFGKEYARDDILSALVTLHHGYEASTTLTLQVLKRKLEPSVPEETERLLSMESERIAKDMVAEFLRQRPEFLSSWEKMAETLKPPVPQITYREFIPGVPLIVPSELATPDGGMVSANSIYDSIFARQRKEFAHFIYEKLNLPRDAGSSEISLKIKDFLMSVETRLFPESDLSTVTGTTRLVESMFDNFPHEKAFSIIPEMASWLLEQYPPMGLLTKWGYGTVEELLKQCDPRDALALASWTEEREYTVGLRKLMAENLRTEHFAPCVIRPLVVSHEEFPSLAEMRDPSALDKLGSGILVSSLHKGMGGEFPKLRYLTTISKNIVEAERFGQVWQRFAVDRKDFGRKVIDSLEGHWGMEPLSAHAIFEDGHQRILVERVRQMAETIARKTAGNNGRVMLAKNLRDLAECYHLALTLPDGKFVTCSAWSWASYSFKGGKKFPTPLSVHVERDWASREFLVEYYKAIGGTEEQVEEKVIELMGQGRESENLAPILLGTERKAEEVVSMDSINRHHQLEHTENLTRFADNPILKPISEHPWESKYVLNAGAIRLDHKVHMIYRAFGDDKISRLGLAISHDSFNFTERLEKPIFEPKGKHEKQGCEDPRLTIIDNQIYMTYTAYDGIVAQIALASIGVNEFLDRQWKKWRRHGLVFPGFNDKDAAIFPEQFDGKYAMLHRVDPHIWITFSSHLRCPWPRGTHKILTGTTTGMMWDGRKIGAGTQPIKTKLGWLLITHGVDFDHVYRLGVMLLDLANPAKLIYRSPNFILEPERNCEIGDNDHSWVPNVVFTCGALPKEDKNILDLDDEIIVYYGAADTVICAATATVGELIPIKP
jgi:predicted GH43/DUF377 family glycosyl hydrolase